MWEGLLLRLDPAEARTDTRAGRRMCVRGVWKTFRVQGGLAPTPTKSQRELQDILV